MSCYSKFQRNGVFLKQPCKVLHESLVALRTTSNLHVVPTLFQSITAGSHILHGQA